MADISVARWSGESAPAPAIIRDGIPVQLTRQELESALVEALAKVERLKAIVDAAIQWRSAEIYHGARVLGIRQGSVAEAEEDKRRRTAELQIMVDQYHRSIPEAAEAEGEPR